MYEDNNAEFGFGANFGEFFTRSEDEASAMYAEEVGEYLREMSEVREISRYGDQVFA